MDFQGPVSSTLDSALSGNIDEEAAALVRKFQDRRIRPWVQRFFDECVNLADHPNQGSVRCSPHGTCGVLDVLHRIHDIFFLENVDSNPCKHT